MKPYLVTGAAGFIGARFVESCNRRKIPVISVDEVGFFDSRSEHRGIDFGTRVDRDSLFDWLKDGQPSLGAIVHMGACSTTTETRWDYLERVNVRYTSQLWDYATSAQVAFIHASSAATYGDGAQGYDDDEAAIGKLEPLNLYGKSKLQSDLWILDKAKAGDAPPSWSAFKFFNVYGFGERHKGQQASVALHAYDQIGKTGQLELFKSHKAGIADGQQKRDFVFVEDVCEVMHFALEKPIRRGIFNLGSGQARSFLELARASFAALGKPEKIQFVDTPVEIRDKYQYFTEARMQKLRAEGYSRPFISLEEGVAKYFRRLQS